MRSRYSGRLVLAAAAACVLAVTATGCGGSGEGEAKVASAEKGGSSAGAVKKSEPDSEVARYVEFQRKVAACLRKEGVEVPDPNALGQIDTSTLGNYKQDSTAREAMQKCDYGQLQMPASIAEALTPPKSPEAIAQDKRYGECMRENGVPEYPELDEKGDPEDVPWDSTSAAAQRAVPLCYEKAYGQKYATSDEVAG
ncbi:hypothetical protein [Streptomyces sp. NBC_00233]|uniref:hypothetical protein n=1 Tax=Streptomyces sp. NBC_00233 TaxID=2975686 RepID=UPI0022560521|nr:hypothetical protein [Streptomyces sp. NBC_00233]MCX5233351.1 hypothetical protein [Streptomyces sp. NBC_00233]